MEHFRRSWAEIDLSAIKENFHTVRNQVAPHVRVMAVVKANAYGHGVERVAALLEREGADYFGVSCLQEAEELRALGIQKPILILGYTAPEFYERVCALKITQTVFDLSTAKGLNAAAEKRGERVKIHIALDTGMGRIGLDAFDPQKAAETIKTVAALPYLEVEGLFSHFSVADTDGEEAYTQEQFARFEAVRALLKEEGICPLCHIANSAGAFSDPRYQLDMVRAGIVLYGHEPGGRENPFQTAMTFKTVISHIKDLPAGRDISYGRRYTTQKPCRVATLSVGYADGYPRCLSNRGTVWIGGRLAPVLGSVCMDQMMVDVTDVPCKVGDEAVLMGGAVDFNEVAKTAGTIHYELICRISKRVPRVYKGKIYEHSATETVTTASTEEISVGKWLLYWLIPLIPVVGIPAYIAMLLIWSFGKERNKTFRNWARSSLLIGGIFVALYLVITVVLIVFLGDKFLYAT